MGAVQLQCRLGLISVQVIGTIEAFVEKLDPWVGRTETALENLGRVHARSTFLGQVAL